MVTVTGIWVLIPPLGLGSATPTLVVIRYNLTGRVDFVPRCLQEWLWLVRKTTPWLFLLVPFPNSLLFSHLIPTTGFWSVTPKVS